MFERLTTPQEAFNWQLGSTLTMEEETERMLGDLAEAAQDPQLKEMFLEHREETRGQITNVRNAFTVFGWEVDDSPCPAIKALSKEGKANIKKTDPAIVDSIILSAAIQTEHHEIAVYESLIINARAMGNDDVVTLLQANLEQEHQALIKAKDAATTVAITPQTPPTT
jgi:ferritin-like metal-binding protein YciE